MNARLFGAIGKKYKLFLMGNEAKTDGVGIFVAEKWADSVVRVERHSERIMLLTQGDLISQQWRSFDGVHLIIMLLTVPYTHAHKRLMALCS